MGFLCSSQSVFPSSSPVFIGGSHSEPYLFVFFFGFFSIHLIFCPFIFTPILNCTYLSNQGLFSSFCPSPLLKRCARTRSVSWSLAFWRCSSPVNFYNCSLAYLYHIVHLHCSPSHRFLTLPLVFCTHYKYQRLEYFF